jgi:hypothetical protein
MRFLIAGGQRGQGRVATNRPVAGVLLAVTGTVCYLAAYVVEA